MASVKVKFRPSSVNGKEGSIYYQVIHNRAVRQIKTDCRIFESEWNGKASAVAVPIMIGRKPDRMGCKTPQGNHRIA